MTNSKAINVELKEMQKNNKITAKEINAYTIVAFFFTALTAIALIVS